MEAPLPLTRLLATISAPATAPRHVVDPIDLPYTNTKLHHLHVDVLLRVVGVFIGYLKGLGILEGRIGEVCGF